MLLGSARVSKGAEQHKAGAHLVRPLHLLYAPPLHPVTSCCINRFQPASPYRQTKVRRRKDDPVVGTAARGNIERLSRFP